MQLAIQAIAIYIVILWLAAAYWAFRDMQLRSENPVLPYLAAALIILFTPVLFLLGVIVYRIVRPQEKIGEVYERNLAEEALLAEVETIKTCPSCTRRVNEEWIICPTCRTRLNRVCANCGRLVGLDWSLCAWCGKDFERADIASYRADRHRPMTPSRLDAPPRIATAALAPARARRHRAPRSAPGAAHRARRLGALERAGLTDPAPRAERRPPDAEPAPDHRRTPAGRRCRRASPCSASRAAASPPSTSSAGSAPSWAWRSSSSRSWPPGTGAARWLFLVGLVVLALGLVAAAGSQAVERGRRAELAYRGPSPVLAFVVVVALTLLAARRRAGAAVRPGRGRDVAAAPRAVAAHHDCSLYVGDDPAAGRRARAR